MCLIVDANVAPRFLVRSSAVIDWLFGERGAPRLVAAGKLRAELALNDSVRRQLVALDRAGRLRSVDLERVQNEDRRLRAAAACLSNDPHVLALALVSGARTLATNDNALAADFLRRQSATPPPLVNHRAVVCYVPGNNHCIGEAACDVRATGP